MPDSTSWDATQAGGTLHSNEGDCESTAVRPSGPDIHRVTWSRQPSGMLEWLTKDPTEALFLGQCPAGWGTNLQDVIHALSH